MTKNTKTGKETKYRQLKTNTKTIKGGALGSLTKVGLGVMIVGSTLLPTTQTNSIASAESVTTQVQQLIGKHCEYKSLEEIEPVPDNMRETTNYPQFPQFSRAMVSDFDEGSIPSPPLPELETNGKVVKVTDSIRYEVSDGITVVEVPRNKYALVDDSRYPIYYDLPHGQYYDYDTEELKTLPEGYYYVGRYDYETEKSVGLVKIPEGHHLNEDNVVVADGHYLVKKLVGIDYQQGYFYNAYQVKEGYYFDFGDYKVKPLAKGHTIDTEGKVILDPNYESEMVLTGTMDCTYTYETVEQEIAKIENIINITVENDNTVVMELINQLNQNMEQLQQTIQDLKVVEDGNNGEPVTEELIEKVATLTEQVDTLIKQNDTILIELDKNSKDIKELQDKLKELQDKDAEQDKAIEDNKNKNEEQDKGIEDNKNKNEEQDKTVEDLTNTVIENDKKVDELYEKLQEEINKLKEAQTKSENELNKVNSEFESKFKELEQQIKDLITENNTTKEELRVLETKQESDSKVIKELQDAIKNIEERTVELDKTVEGITINITVENNNSNNNSNSNNNNNENADTNTNSNTNTNTNSNDGVNNNGNTNESNANNTNTNTDNSVVSNDNSSDVRSESKSNSNSKSEDNSVKTETNTNINEGVNTQNVSQTQEQTQNQSQVGNNSVENKGTNLPTNTEVNKAILGSGNGNGLNKQPQLLDKATTGLAVSSNTNSPSILNSIANKTNEGLDASGIKASKSINANNSTNENSTNKRLPDTGVNENNQVNKGFMYSTLGLMSILGYVLFRRKTKENSK